MMDMVKARWIGNKTIQEIYSTSTMPRNTYAQK